jgi:lysosomal acid lipase/cholesteryl ester hydrolase
MVPELGEKLSLFIALAPAVYAGPLTTGFPFGALKSMKWKTWRRWFGAPSSSFAPPFRRNGG